MGFLGVGRKDKADNIVLYHSPPTRSVRVFWLLKELDVPFEVKRVDFFKKETYQTEDYKKLNPQETLPTYIEGEGSESLVLHESGAIVQYVLSKYGRDKLQPQAGTAQYGEMLNWFWFAEATFNQTVVSMLNHKALLPENMRVAAEGDRFAKTLVALLEQLEAQLKGKKYLMGEDFSAADIMLGQSLTLVFKFAPDMAPPLKYPAVTAYYNLLAARPGYQAAYE